MNKKLEDLIIAGGTIAVITGLYQIANYYHEKDYRNFTQKVLPELINNETKQGIVDLDTLSLQSMVNHYNKGKKESRFEINIGNNTYSITIKPKQNKDNVYFEVKIVEESKNKTKEWLNFNYTMNGKESLYVDLTKNRLFSGYSICKNEDYNCNLIKRKFESSQ